MPKETISDLTKFLEPYSEHIKELTFRLREFAWDLYPNCNELIYDNYNALAFGWSLSDRQGDTFCSIAVLPKYVHFGFYRGTDIADPEKMLLGKGNQYRYIIVKEFSDFPKTYIKKLLKDAYANSLARLKINGEKPTIKGLTITKSISPVKKRPA
jgi:hypothetical protein